MKCFHCGNEVSTYYIGNTESQPLCQSCLMTLSHTLLKPILCSRCGHVISKYFVLTNSNGIFCSTKCFAESIGFRERVEDKEKIEDKEV